MATTYAYRHVATFARRFDEARPSWPLELIAEALALDDVVDVAFNELVSAWRPGADAGVALRESRRRVLEVVTVSSSKSRADVARRRVLELVVRLKGDQAERVPVTRELVDVDVV